MAGGPKPILFLLGPSGSGKSTIAKWVQADLGYLHIEIDRWPDGDGIDIEGIRVQWNLFLHQIMPSALADEIQRRIMSAQSSGAIVSFPSDVVFSQDHIDQAREQGICTAVLYGTGVDCVEAFLRRESKLNRGLGVEHWVNNNAYSYALFSTPQFAPYRMMSFENGKHRERQAIVRDIYQLTK